MCFYWKYGTGGCAGAVADLFLFCFFFFFAAGLSGPPSVG